MIRRTFGWLGLVTVLAGTALAAEPGSTDFARTGWYLGGGATYAFEDFRTGAAGDAVGIDDSAGFKLLGGYRAHPNFAAELDLDYLHGFDVNVGGTRAASIRGVATTINGKGYLTTGRVQPYGVAGVGGLYVAGLDSSLDNILGVNGGFLARFGGGMDLYATEHVVLNAEATYDLPTGDVSSLRFVPVTLGAQYRF
jgi:opacity protein-like surface antigen